MSSVVGETKRRSVWFVRVSPQLDRALEELKARLGYATKAEVLRALVRQECERRGIEVAAEG